MRISDWSSDVCSSDLAVTRPLRAAVVAVVLALLGSACSVLNAENIPVATGVEDPYSITVFFPDALNLANGAAVKIDGATVGRVQEVRSEEQTSELQSLMRNSYAVFRLTNKNNTH